MHKLGINGSLRYPEKVGKLSRKTIPECKQWPLHIHLAMLSGLTREFGDVVGAMRGLMGGQAMTTSTMASTMVR